MSDIQPSVPDAPVPDVDVSGTPGSEAPVPVEPKAVAESVNAAAPATDAPAPVVDEGASPVEGGVSLAEGDDSAEAAGGAYRVSLDSYAGPLDLLLYLIRKEEVDIYDIPIARIAEQYQHYIEVMAELNVNVAGEFLVMAATLMEIKSRMLLPTEEGIAEEEEDPRAELVRQLLEYKRYRDLARELGNRAAVQTLKFSRPAQEKPEETADAAEDMNSFLAGVGLWELIEAFSKVLKETSVGEAGIRVLERQRPIQEYRHELLALVVREGPLTFSKMFVNCRTKDDMIATFIALLELVRLRRIFLQRGGEPGELYLRAQPEESDSDTMLDADSESLPPPERPAEPEPSVEGQPRERVAHYHAVHEVDVLSEIEEEDESLGNARKRIDEALAKAEAFLKMHHDVAQGEGQAAEGQPGVAASAAPAADAVPAHADGASADAVEPTRADAVERAESEQSSPGEPAGETGRSQVDE